MFRVQVSRRPEQSELQDSWLNPYSLGSVPHPLEVDRVPVRCPGQRTALPSDKVGSLLRLGLALTCWLGGAGRFSSARKAVRFAGLDITVYSSDGKRSPGHLSRQGPPVLRWCAYEAAKAGAHATAPDHPHYAAVRDRAGGKRAALAEARKIIRRACHILTELGDDAFTTG